MDISVVKVVSRFLHLTSTGVLSGICIFNYMFNADEILNDEPFYETIGKYCGMISFATGVANMFLIKHGKTLEKGTPSRNWLHILEIKFFMALLLTPAVKPLISFLKETGMLSGGQKEAEEFKKALRFWLIMAMTLMSGGAKTYREFICNNFDKDPVSEKVEQFSKKYQGIERDIKSGKRKEPIKVKPVNLQADDNSEDDNILSD